MQVFRSEESQTFPFVMKLSETGCTVRFYLKYMQMDTVSDCYINTK
jgi:hypothetical protein